jgi:hypothetical protein
MNANGYCDECGEPFAHAQGPGGQVAFAGETCLNGHASKNANGYCDECGEPFPGAVSKE